MVELSFIERGTLGAYLKSRSGNPWASMSKSRLLRMLNDNGIKVKKLDDLPSSPMFNPALLEFDASYMARRIETAYALKEDLQQNCRDVDLENCYLGIDRLVTEEHKGKVGERATFAEGVLRDVQQFIREPNQNPYSFRSRVEHMGLLEVLGATGLISAAEAFLQYESYNPSILAAVTAGTIGAIGGFIASVYIDSWSNHDLIAVARKITGGNPKNDPSLLVGRVHQMEQRYDKLVSLVNEK